MTEERTKEENIKYFGDNYPEFMHHYQEIERASDAVGQAQKELQRKQILFDAFLDFVVEGKRAAEQRRMNR